MISLNKVIHGYKPDWIIFDFSSNANQVHLSTKNIKHGLKIANSIVSLYFALECSFVSLHSQNTVAQVRTFLCSCIPKSGLNDISICELKLTLAKPQTFITLNTNEVEKWLNILEPSVGSVLHEVSLIQYVKVIFKNKKVTLSFRVQDSSYIAINYSEHVLDKKEREDLSCCLGIRMDLPSCQKHNTTVYRQIITNLLEWNTSHDSPSQDFLEVAQYLSSLGFLSLREYYFIVCANDTDDSDFRVIDSFCNNRLEIASDYDEEYDDPIMCDLCNRDILPDTYEKQRYHSLEINVNHLKVIEWFEEQLANLNITSNKVATGVYYVIVGTSLVSLIIPDCCSDKSYLTLDKLKTNPTVLISFNEKNLKPLLNLYIIPMADLICGYRTLNEILNETVEKGVPKLLPNVSFQALNCYPYIPLQQTKLATQEKILQLRIKNGGIYINDIEVVNKQSKLGMNIFFVLLEQFWCDFKEGISPGQHKALTIEQIADYLGNISDAEQQIRKPINRMQRTMVDKLAITLGMNVKRDDIIQTLPWSGIGIKEYGYRLNPSTLSLKK